VASVAEIAVVYCAGLAQGLALVSFPAAATILTAPDGYGLTSNQYGSIFLPLFAGAVLASLLAPAQARRRGLKTVLLAGFACNAVSMGTFALSSTLIGMAGLAYVMILTATGLLGLGFGAVLTAINAYAASFFPRRSETAITALHTLLGTGTALAPLIVSFLAEGGDWWLLPLSTAIAAVILLAVSLTQPLALAAGGGTGPGLGMLSVAKALPARFWLWIAFALLYGICETLFGNWGTVYLHQQRALPDATANLALAVFWAAVTIGRLLVAVISTAIPPLVIFRALPVLIAAALAAVAWSTSATLGIAAFGLAGLACSACLPLSIGTASSETPQFVETASGWMVASYMMGFGVGAFAVGPIRQLADLQLSHVYQGAIIIAIVLILLANFLVRGSSTVRSGEAVPRP
jgi:fucose permease